MLSRLARFPFRVVRRVVRRFTGRRDTTEPEVRLPGRTDPEGPNLRPTAASPAAPSPSAPSAPSSQAATSTGTPLPSPATPAHEAPPAEARRESKAAASSPVPEANAEAPQATDAGTAGGPVGANAEAPQPPEDDEAPKAKGKGKKKAKEAEEETPKAKGKGKKKAESVEPEAGAVVPEAPGPSTPVITVRGDETPNPNAMKFTASVPVVPKGSLSFATAVSASGHPLGEALFALDGVKVVFAVKDFVTVTKTEDADWDTLQPRVEAAIAKVLAAR